MTMIKQSEKKLEDLGPGDKVIVPGGFRLGYVRAIDRVTKTQIIVGRNRYSRNDGYPVPCGRDAWTRKIRVATEEGIAEIEEEEKRFNAKGVIHRANLDGLTTDQLERIRAIIESSSNP